MAAPDRPLAGVGVLVTRPAHQAAYLVQLIEADGGRTIRFPTIEIVDAADTRRLHDVIDRIAQFDIALFVSPNAVHKGLTALGACARSLSARTIVAAVGEGTARALREFGIDRIHVPERFTSEGILELPALAAVAGSQVIIFRGSGGRELLGQALSARGAHVEYAECYRRVRPDADADALVRQWNDGQVQIVSVTSNDGLRNLHDMLGSAGRACLRATPIVIVSEAQAATCRALDLAAPIVARSAADEAILEAIRAWRARQISL